VSRADRFGENKLLKLAHRSWNSYGSPPLWTQVVTCETVCVQGDSVKIMGGCVIWHIHLFG